MVIYLKMGRELLLKILIVLFLIVFIVSSGYFSTFVKYNDKNLVEYEVLKNENDILKRELNNLENIEIKYDNYVMGKVIYRDMYNFYEEIVINKGKEYVNKGDAVVDSDGLVGIIDRVEKDASYVKLLSSSYNVSVLINDTYGNLSNGTISLLDKYSDIKEGDKVYTSGYGDAPKGIYIGKVSKVTYDKEKLGKEVKVELINNKNLNYVGVIKKIK